jgi:hypothetical protein
VPFSVERPHGHFAKDGDRRIGQVLGSYKIVSMMALALVGDAKAANELYEKALSMVDTAVKSKSPSEQAIYSSADSYTGLGDAELKLAGKQTQHAKQLEHWKKACEMYAVSLKTWSAIPEPGVESLEGFECVPPQAVAARLKRCQAAVSKDNAHP